MPTLPTYESQKKPVSQVAISNQPAVVRQEGAERAYEGMQTIAQGASEVLQKWQTAVDTMDYTLASAEASTRLSAIKLAAKNDPNPDNANTYLLQAQEVKKGFAGKFHNKELAQKASFELDSSINIASLEIGNTFKQKQLLRNRVAIDATIDNLVKEKLGTNNPNIKAQADQKIFALVSANQANGTISMAEAEAYLTGAKIIEVKYLIASDTAITESGSKLLKDLNNKNEFSDIPWGSKERLGLINDAQKRIFQNNQAQKVRVDTNEDSVTATLADKNKPQPSREDIIMMLNNKEISPSFAKATIKNIESIQEAKEDRGADFSKLVDYIVNPENDPADIREEMMLKQAQGDINQEEFNILYTFSKQANVKAVDDMSPQKTFIRSIYDWSDANAGLKTIESRARMFKDYMIQVNEGKDPEEAVKDVIKREVQNLHPDIATYPEEGQLVFDAYGNIKIIKPDGTITEPKAKK